MEYKLFSLLRKKDTQELHLFRSRKDDNQICRSELLSICKKMGHAENDKTIFSCESEDIARQKCAEIGRQVCGTCVSNLYADYK